MSIINKTDIKLMASQRLDDTDEGGGQKTSIEIISGSVNNLFPDISRLDRVYGRVSMRKGFLAVETPDRPTYYGSHAVITKNADDPNVSVCFFSSKDWFDTREAAKNRIESFLVKGPTYMAIMWGNHYIGTKIITLIAEEVSSDPSIGDVMVFVKNEGLTTEVYQYVRITAVGSEVRDFFYYSGTTELKYRKRILTLHIGDILTDDYIGQEVTPSINYNVSTFKCYTTVAADASRYYGVTEIATAATAGELQIKVASINVPLVPSAQTQTAITDSGVAGNASPMLQTDGDVSSITRTISYSISLNSKLYLGEGILPGSFTWTGGMSLDDSTKDGNIWSAGTIVGSIDYPSGTIIFNSVSGTVSGTGTATYKPACGVTEITTTGGIPVEINNRGFVYVYTCTPIPKAGTLVVSYLAGGKWYSIKDKGNGALRSFFRNPATGVITEDTSIGSGSLNLSTGTVSLTLGAMPDVGSTIFLAWSKGAQYYSLAKQTPTVTYKFTTMHPGVARNTFICSWNSDAVAVMDDGAGKIVEAVWSVDHWIMGITVLGTIEYATGVVSFLPKGTQALPSLGTSFQVRYAYGEKISEVFNPIRDGLGRVSFTLTNLPIVPGSFKIVWHTDQEEYDGTSGIRRHIDPTHTFLDDGNGLFEGDAQAISAPFITNWIQGSVDYNTGVVQCMPDRVGVFPVTTYIWKDTGLFDEFHVELREYVFHSVQYRPAASMWPTDGTLECEYTSADGAFNADYLQTVDQSFFVKPESYLEIVPGSLSFYAYCDVTNNNRNIVDKGDGKLYRDTSGTNGVGVQCGTVDYSTRTITIQDTVVNARSINIISCSGSVAVDPVQMMVFRTPGSPIVPASFSLTATLGTGVVLNATSDFNGIITGTGVLGSINFETGICRISFGAWVTDTWSALPTEEQPEWYVGAPIDAAFVWKPYSVRASTVKINCVVTSYLPLDASLLGLDPVRLPMDGKVPIFRDGYIILIHNTVDETLTSNNPFVGGTVITLNRSDVNLIEVYDSTGRYVPEIGDDGVGGSVPYYSVDLPTATITVAATIPSAGVLASLTDPLIYPFHAIHRIEDMCLASDVQITGHIAITRPLTHSYPLENTLVSSVLPSADLQGRAYNEFDQSSWTGVWSDSLIGVIAAASYNFVDYPITVSNIGATKERWCIKFTGTTTFDIIGEHLGILAQLNLNDFVAGSFISLTNNLTGELYFSIARNGFGVGWAAGNCIRFNTDAANFPYWFVRTTLQAPPTEPTDSYEFQIRGDSA